MSRMLEILQRTDVYRSMLEQVPEEQREAAVAALKEQLKPYETLLGALPNNAIDNFVTSLNKSMETGGQPTAQAERRPPRRF